MRDTTRRLTGCRDVHQDLDRLLQLPEGVSSAALPETSLTHAMAAWAGLAGVLQLLANEDNFHRFSLARFDLNQVRCSHAAP